MIRMKMTRLFLDRKKVVAKVDAATRRVLGRFGAYVRRTARSSIRKRKRPSRPGQPPSSHTGLLKRFIWFAYEPREKSVVIGPARLSRKGRGEAPSLLEYGGSTRVSQDGETKRARYRPRPFMGPAFEKEQPKLPSMWKGSIK